MVSGPDGNPSGQSRLLCDVTIERRLFITVFVLLTLHAAPDGRQFGRYASATAALVEHHTFEISAFDVQPEPVHDWVTINGHVYSAIPPGIPLLLAPSYFVYSTLAQSLRRSSPQLYWDLFSLWACATVMAPTLSMGAVVMFRLLRRYTPLRPRQLWLTFGLIFGTPVFFFATSIWGHNYSMVVALITFYAIVERWRPAAVGALLGIALTLEFQNAVPVALLAAFWLFDAARRQQVATGVLMRHTLELLAGIAPFALAMLAYNYAFTGHPLMTMVTLWLPTHNPGVSSFAFPSLARLWQVTFSRYFGLFLFAPLTMFTVAAAWRRVWRHDPEIQFCYVFAGVLFVFLMMTAHGLGENFGPRYFIVALPFALIPLARWPPRWLAAGVMVSILVNWAGASTNASGNLFMTLGLFLARGPYLRWLEEIRTTVLPSCCGISLYIMTPFWLDVAVAIGLWQFWGRPRLRSRS